MLEAFDQLWTMTEASSAPYAQYGTSGSNLDLEFKGVRRHGEAIEPREVQVQDSEDGNHLSVRFGDDACFLFKAGWLRDASPQCASASYTRADPNLVLNSEDLRVVEASVEEAVGGETINVRFNDGTRHEFRGDWLRAFSPFVAIGLDEAAFEPLQFRA